MNKADKAQALREEMRKAEPGLMAAFATVGIILGACLVVAVAIYGLMSTIDFIDVRGSVIGELPDIPAYARTAHAIPA